jgi:acetyl-CoA carboxylase biotin carboxyl carrier protein
VKIDLDQLRQLLQMVGQTEVTELTIENGDEKITVRKSAAAQNTQIEIASEHFTAPPVKTAPPPAKEETKRPKESNHEDVPSSNGLVAIASPMVGTFYRSPSPAASPFVDIGDRISPGQTVCIIEAMKLMNDLPAEISGKIVKICVDNGTTVEYGQALFMVDPRG